MMSRKNEYVADNIVDQNIEDELNEVCVDEI